MKKVFMAMALVGLMGAATGVAAQEAATAQQQKMTVCNQQASKQSLKGDERKTFMSSCLKKNSTTADGKVLTAQQQRMKDCNAQAKSKSLAGDARKTFMSSCLKK